MQIRTRYENHTYHLSCSTAGSSEERSHLLSAAGRSKELLRPQPTAFIVAKPFFFYLSIFTLSVAGRLPIWCSSPVVGLTFQHLQSDLLRFPFPSWIADTEHRISLNSSPVKSRKTSAINHSPSSFRFRWGNATRTKSGAKPFNPNSKWV